MKKVLSILLMGSMLGAPILSSNCSAYKIDGNVSTNINALVDKIYAYEGDGNKSVADMFKSLLYTNINEIKDEGSLEENTEKRCRIEEALSSMFGKNISIDSNDELIKLKKSYIDRLTEEEKLALEKSYKYYKEKLGVVDYSESSEYIEEKNLNDNKENLNIDLGKNVTAKLDEKATKKNKSPMFKIIVAGAVFAVVTYAGLIAYDMYYNERSFMEANSNLLNTISNWANSFYNCSSEYIKKFAESVKDYANKTYDYIKNNVSQTQLNQTISNTTGEAQVNQTIDDIKEILPIEEDYCDINDGYCDIDDKVMESIKETSSEESKNATGSNFVEGVGVAGAVGGALATAGRFLSQNPLSIVTVLPLLGTIVYGIFYTYCAYQM